MPKTVTARLPKELVKRIDTTVRLGAFSSRSEALRTIVEKYLRENTAFFVETEPDTLLGDEVSDKELEKLGAKLFTGVKVARLVGEGRGG